MWKTYYGLSAVFYFPLIHTITIRTVSFFHIDFSIHNTNLIVIVSLFYFNFLIFIQRISSIHTSIYCNHSKISVRMFRISHGNQHKHCKQDHTKSKHCVLFFHLSDSLPHQKPHQDKYTQNCKPDFISS